MAMMERVGYYAWATGDATVAGKVAETFKGVAVSHVSTLLRAYVKKHPESGNHKRNRRTK